MKIIVYTKDGCGYCVAAKKWLSERGVSYEERDVNDNHKRQALYEDINRRFGKNVYTVPQIVMFDDGLETHIGGYDELLSSDVAKRSVRLNDLDF